MSEKKAKNYLYEGPIPSEKVAQSVEAHKPKVHCGAHTIFLGSVRADELEGRTVAAIEYSAYPEMANKVIAEIREEAFARWDLACLHVHHSVGRVNVGEVGFMVMVSAGHRGPVFPALEYLVNEIKARVPIWKKEIFADGSETWVEGQGMGISPNSEQTAP